MFERIKAMDRRTIIPLLLAGVIGVLLFSTIVGGIRQAGWNEGFMVGLLAGGGEQAKAVAPALAHGGYPGFYGGHGWGWHPFGFIGGFFRFLFFGFLLLLFVKFIAFRRWRMHGGHPWHHHPHGPWARPGGWGPQAGPHSGPQAGQPYGQHPEQAQATPGPQPSPAQPEAPPPQPVSWVKV